MLKKISCCLFCAGILITPWYSWASQHALIKGMSFNYEFPPNDPQIFDNTLIWTINATCNLTSPDETNEVFAAILKKKGKINEQPLSQGESLIIMIRSGDKLKISAEPGARASITNQGEHTFLAQCTA